MAFGYGREGAIRRAVGRSPVMRDRPPKPVIPSVQPEPRPMVDKQLPAQAAAPAQANVSFMRDTPPQPSPPSPSLQQVDPFAAPTKLNQGVPLSGDSIRMQQFQRALDDKMRARNEAQNTLFNRRLV